MTAKSLAALQHDIGDRIGPGFASQPADVSRLLNDMAESFGTATAVKLVSAATYTLLQDDNNTIIDFLVACTVTVPPALTLPYVVGISQGGGGQVMLTPGVGVTINEPDGFLKTEKQYVQLILAAFATDDFRLSGRTVA